MEKLAVLGGEKAVTMETKRWPDDFLVEFGKEERKAVEDVLKRGVVWGTYAPEITAFQEEFANYIGVKHALAMNSGTATLHCAMAAAGIGPGDEVITSAHTFIASASSVLHHNAIPIFVDIDERTYNIDPEKIEEKITEKTKAIEPVHVFGLPADMDPILEIAERHGLLVVEDAAEADGAVYKGKKVGSLGDMACFSLNATKNIMTAEGGVFVTDNDEFRDRASRVRTFGEIIRLGVPRRYKAYEMGWNYRINELQAAMARVQLRRLDDLNEARIKNADYLTEHLGEIPGLMPPYVPRGRKHVYWQYRIRVNPEELNIRMTPKEFRDRLVVALQAEGIPVTISMYEPVYMQPLFQTLEGYGKGCPWKCQHARADIKYEEGDCPVTEQIGQETFNICVHPPNDLKLMEQYVNAFEKIIRNAEQLKSIEHVEWAYWSNEMVPARVGEEGKVIPLGTM